VFIPPVISAIVLLIFTDIIDIENVPEFFILFWIFGCTLNTFSYLFSHIFNDPETGIKYISMIYSLGFLIGPLVLWGIFSSLLSGGRQNRRDDDNDAGADEEE